MRWWCCKRRTMPVYCLSTTNAIWEIVLASKPRSDADLELLDVFMLKKLKREIAQSPDAD